MTPARILLLNVNTNTTMTQRMHAVAMSAAAPGTEVIATEPEWGTSSVEGYYDGYVSVAGALDRLHGLLAHPDPKFGTNWTAVIWAGFGDHGREGAQELLSIPVITIAEAAAHVAMLLGHKFGIVTTLRRSCSQIEDVLRVAGLLERCAGIWPTGVDVLDAATSDDDALLRHCVTVGSAALAGGAEVLCLGSGALAGLAEPLSTALDVPVVDGVASAVSLAESLHRLNLATSKINSYASPRPKDRPGWPPSQRATRPSVE